MNLVSFFFNQKNCHFYFDQKNYHFYSSLNKCTSLVVLQNMFHPTILALLTSHWIILQVYSDIVIDVTILSF